MLRSAGQTMMGGRAERRRPDDAGAVRGRIAVCCALLVASLAVAACGAPDPADALPPASAALFAPLGQPLPLLDDAQRERFAAGRRAMLRRFSVSEGLGPRFSATSCAGCHERPVVGGSASRYRNVFVVANAASSNVVVEQPQFSVGPKPRAPAAAGARLVMRNPVPLFGMGLIAELPAEAIVARADPRDADGDGISGRVNFERGFVGRFGRKAQLASLSGFIRLALRDHLGLTSGRIDPNVDPVVSPVNLPTVDDDRVTDAEVSNTFVKNLIGFVSGLAAPRPDPPTVATRRGRALFESVGCAGCHTPAIEGPHGAVPLYSDLLLHDMGSELTDGVRVGEADASEFRTQPLWGVSATGPYLHDGRADTVQQAIAAHGGEAKRARQAFSALSAGERGDLIAFLRSLGGASQVSDGLLPRGASSPAPGSPGGPIVALSASDQRRFDRGRAVFDRDYSIRAGLGPGFNGDACRSCHFDPVLGGAGPGDVDVVRQSLRDASGKIVAPGAGTMVHRFDVSGRRPAVVSADALIELRNPPTTLGLGLVDRIPAATITALADPEDADGDGISGRAHILPDGRLGRLGWKANFPSVEEFTRDALSNELGLTVPRRAHRTSGRLKDADGVLDPEIEDADYDALVFFMRMLAPPAPKKIAAKVRQRGLEVFREVGCHRCHVPQLLTADRTRVRLYSDLLLHDVMAAGKGGIPAGSASPREMRTPPLWGLSNTAPYMHDGRAATIAQAIERHDGEARRARKAFDALGSKARSALLTFLQSL